MKASVTSDADTPGHYLYSTGCHYGRGAEETCLRVSVRVDWIEFLITSESSLLARLLNVTCVFGEIDAFASRWFAKNLASAKNILSRRCLTRT